MKQATDTIFRQWHMLRLIPRYPGSVGTRELKDKLEREEGFTIDIRTIQRDLEKLSGIFPLTSEADGKAMRWFWMKNAALFDIPGMDQQTALAFRLASAYLTPLLPLATVNHLQPHFQRAKEILEPKRGAGLSLWPDKVCPIVRGPDLLTPEIKPEVQEVVTQALLQNRQAAVTYRSKEAEQAKSYSVHPLGLVFRDGIVYLVCTVKDYPDIRHLALHRMTSAELQDAPSRRPAGFTLERYVKKEKFFAYPLNGTLVQLEVLFEKDAAFHLSERTLAKDQRLIPQEDGRVLLQATVRDTLELRWWLLGFGDKIEVVGPKALREEFKLISRRMAARYQPGT